MKQYSRRERSIVFRTSERGGLVSVLHLGRANVLAAQCRGNRLMSVQIFLLALCCVFFVSYTGWVHWTIITTPAQLDLTEGAVLKQVQGIMAGIGVYSTEGQPEYLSLYGIGHPLFHTAVSQLFGN